MNNNYNLSHFAPNDDDVITTNGKLKVSKLYYKMNPKRDPVNRIKEIQELFLNKCLSSSYNKSSRLDAKFQKNIKDIQYINECHNKNLNKNNSVENIFNNNFDDYSKFFPTSIKVENNKDNTNNYSSSKNSETHMPSVYFNNPNILNTKETKENNENKKNIVKSHSQILKLDKTYCKAPLSRLYVLGKRNKDWIFPRHFSNVEDPKVKFSYLQFDYDIEKTKNGSLGQLKQYEMKESQNLMKPKPFVY